MCSREDRHPSECIVVKCSEVVVNGIAWFVFNGCFLATCNRPIRGKGHERVLVATWKKALEGFFCLRFFGECLFPIRKLVDIVAVSLAYTRKSTLPVGYFCGTEIIVALVATLKDVPM